MSVYDAVSKLRFLIDSGADISVFPVDGSATHNSCDSPTLVASNGSDIKTFGTKRLSLELPGLRLQHTFRLASVARPILGADFFRRHGLLIDVKHSRLLREDGVPIVVERDGLAPGLRSVEVQPDLFRAILNQYPQISQPRFDADALPAHGVLHAVPTSGQPLSARSRPLFGDKLRVAKDEFEKMSQMGIIQPSSSPWASPLHMVPKPSGSWRP